MAVFPVPGAPANKTALPAIFLLLMRSTAMPAACQNNQRNVELLLVLTHLAGFLLPNQPSSNGIRFTCIVKAEPLDMTVRRDSLSLCG
mmetsp:Transcript_61054/g.164009  ORF Transcript_61054/g.164009 Transcript_61054/m.164009 type:complete len:88 (+) Transcript_61054:2817-3080(+)